MSTATWCLFVLIPVGALAYVMWAHRKRATERDAASRERLAALMAVQSAAPGASRKPHAVAAPAAAMRPAPAPVSPLLNPIEILVYYVLKAGLPDHEIFPRVGLAAVLGAPRAQGHGFPHQIVDFVVCDKGMRVVAAIVLEGPGRSKAEDLAGSLVPAGIRLVRLNAAAPPRREQVHALVYGPQRTA
jgi:hypothetical protein